MRYQLKQDLWSLGTDFTIKDAGGNDVFIVDGKSFSLADKLSFQDLEGNELAWIQQKLLSLKTRYDIYRNGELFAEVTKDRTFFKEQYSVDVPGPNDYVVTGNFWKHEYGFSRRGREIATVSKAYFKWTDTYGIEIIDGEDDITILATAVVLDMVNRPRGKTHSL